MPGKKCYGRGAVSVKSAREAARFGKVSEIAEQGRRCRQARLCGGRQLRSVVCSFPKALPDAVPAEIATARLRGLPPLVRFLWDTARPRLRHLYALQGLFYCCLLARA